jgi:hypothetical protein
MTGREPLKIGCPAPARNERRFLSCPVLNVVTTKETNVPLLFGNYKVRSVTEVPVGHGQ